MKTKRVDFLTLMAVAIVSCVVTLFLVLGPSTLVLVRSRLQGMKTTTSPSTRQLIRAEFQELPQNSDDKGRLLRTEYF